MSLMYTWNTIALLYMHVITENKFILDYIIYEYNNGMQKINSCCDTENK